MQANDAVERKDSVLVRVANEQRTRREHRRQLWVIPAIRVQEKHAVAMAFDCAVHNVILQIGDAGDRRGDSDAVVERRNRPAIRAAA